MRRILTAAGFYLAGLMTLPLLMLGGNYLDSLQSHTVRIDGAADVVTVVHHAQPIAVNRAASPSLRVQEFAKAAAPTIIEQPTMEVAQVDTKASDVDPFGSGTLPAPVIQRQDLGLEPAAAPAVPAITLPVESDTLASDAALDEAGLAKVKELRETLKKLIEEKSAKMSAAALEREIEMHRQHLADMNALEELLRLEQSLKELGDKFPNSDSGRKAKELLKALDHLRTPGGGIAPVRRALPGAQPIQPRTF